ncbi:exosome complex protein Rrp42 [Candidatus Woesearchaeota archaeon]|jgi:exosome complex component RRP42|nr:exosome complex protein Rrp42 [Candidatus Woesearchaeota archaeon]MBT7062342.1 exosome complex protein Rrp42 [Candidatus Woesearchaeota archaeon]MBT7403151.1 exosome complex protein Rrp42 [Candidatus Woesearchaeota archaeon]
MNNKENSNLKDYLSKLLKKKIREDGRKPFDYRKISVETGILSQANGSARVKLGDTEVLAGVKIGAGTPYPDGPADGTLMVNSELSPIASDRFESGPPSPASIELSRVIDRAIRESGTIDVSKLCIKSGEKVWMVFVDVYPINDDGNLFDIGLIAAMAALKNARMPKYDEKTEQVNHRELTKDKLPINEEPVMCTFGKLDGEIFVDSTEREELVMDSRLSIGITKKGNICAMQKGGEGTITSSEMMDMIKKAQELSKDLRKNL